MKSNAEKLLDELRQEVEKKLPDLRGDEGPLRYRPVDASLLLKRNQRGETPIHDVMRELFNRRQEEYEQAYFDRIDDLDGAMKQGTRQDQVDAVWEFFDGHVERASLYLYAHWPDDFFFYRKTEFELPMLDGLYALSGICPELGIGLEKGVRRKSREDYDLLNVGLQTLSRRLWPDKEDRPLRLLALVYWCIPEKTKERSADQAIWLGMASAEQNVEDILEDEIGAETGWSASARVKEGDIYLMWCTSPRSSIRAIYRVMEDAVFDPTGGWKAHWVNMVKLADVNVPFARLNAHPVTQKWGPVRRHFQGVVVEPVPPAVYETIREMIASDGEETEALPKFKLAEEFEHGAVDSEATFEEDVILPLLKGMGFSCKRQAPCTFHVGTSTQRCRIDVLVVDPRNRPVTLVETKRSLKTPEKLNAAYRQARSYAQQLNLWSFVLASSDGLRVFGRGRKSLEFTSPDAPVLKMSWGQVEREEPREALRQELIKYQLGQEGA
jgi:hypothetical protein